MQNRSRVSIRVTKKYLFCPGQGSVVVNAVIVLLSSQCPVKWSRLTQCYDTVQE